MRERVAFWGRVANRTVCLSNRRLTAGVLSNGRIRNASDAGSGESAFDEERWIPGRFRRDGGGV